MKSKIICALLLISAVFSFAACGESEKPHKSQKSETKTVITVDIAAAKEEILKIDGLNEPLELDKESVCALYNIEVADVTECECITTMDGSFPDEIIMLKAPNADAQNRIYDMLKLRLDDVLKQSKNYDPENYAIAQKCKIIKSGDTIALFVSAHHEQMEKIFKDKEK